MGRLSPEKRMVFPKVAPVQNSVTVTLSQATLSPLPGGISQEIEDVLCACSFSCIPAKPSCTFWGLIPILQMKKLRLREMKPVAKVPSMVSDRTRPQTQAQGTPDKCSAPASPGAHPPSPPLAHGPCFLPLQAQPPARMPGPRPASGCPILWRRVPGRPRWWTSRTGPSHCSSAAQPAPPSACTASAWRPPLATRAPASCWVTSPCSSMPGAQVSCASSAGRVGRWAGLDPPMGTTEGGGMARKRHPSELSEAYCIQFRAPASQRPCDVRTHYSHLQRRRQARGSKMTCPSLRSYQDISPRV